MGVDWTSFKPSSISKKASSAKMSTKPTAVSELEGVNVQIANAEKLLTDLRQKKRKLGKVGGNGSKK